jgi:sulfide:quinone oxidoreductase
MYTLLNSIDAVANVEGLCYPKGFVITDKYQRSPT